MTQCDLYNWVIADIALRGEARCHVTRTVEVAVNGGTKVRRQPALACQPRDRAAISEADRPPLARRSGDCGLCWHLRDSLPSRPGPEPSG